ncbi:hypothetical protein BJV74DRAFT_802004 [Russula compacta]|nr:hypothetical protein BJV74DRAFT_802004 [Russula compacta]
MPTPQWDLSNLLLIKSPFLLVRFVVLSLQIYLNFSALVFAIWNVGASRAAGAHVDGASAFIIFNGITSFLCVTSALMDMRISFFSTSMMGFECIWTGIFTTLQIAASVFVTLSGPPEFCELKAPILVCASITILVPISWLAAISLLGYFVAISTLCVTHLRLYPALWFTSIYSIVWFVDDVVADKRSSVPQLPPLNTSAHTRLSVLSRRHSTPSLPRDVENQPSNNLNLDKPLPSPAPSNIWWGRLLPGRPGRDHPFGFRRARAPEYQWWVKEDHNDQEAGGDNAPPKYPDSEPQSPVDDRLEWVHAEQALRA